MASSGSDNGQVRFRWTSVKRRVNVKSEYELFIGGCETCQQSKSYPYNSALWRCEIVRYKWQWIKSDRSEVKLPEVSQTLKDTNWTLDGVSVMNMSCVLLNAGYWIVARWHKWYKWPIPLSVVSQLFLGVVINCIGTKNKITFVISTNLCIVVNSLFLKYCSNKKDQIVLCLIQYILWYDTNFMAGTEILLRLEIF